MKKKIILFLMFMLVPFSVKADTIYKVDMNININEDGSANVQEIWDVKASGGSEWYKSMLNMDGIELTDFKVSMDNQELTYKTWNPDESLSAKKGYYGINYVSNGLELCFGKYDFKRHTFTLTYKLSNFVFNTSDSQITYFTLMPSITANAFSATISSYYEFPDTLDVWGYGYKGYAYVKDGKIYMINEEGLYNDYVTMLVKYPQETFKTDFSVDRFESFDDVYNMAEEGTFDYDYDDNYEKPSLFERIIDFIATMFPILIAAFFTFIGIKAGIESGYGYVNNKKIDKKNTPMFRDIPCNKDIYYANALISLNGFANTSNTNILGAIILKWVKEEKISFKTEIKGMFNKETGIIDMTKQNTFDNPLEEKLFDYMYKASVDGYLESKELEKWCRKNYEKFFDLIKKFESTEINKLKSEGHIYKRANKAECKKRNVMDDKIYDDSCKLYGLKLYLDEFSRMDTKEVMEVHLWDEYLMFAYLFGTASKVAKQLKNLYPQEFTEYTANSGVNLDTIVFINNISVRSVNAASSARSAAQSYSSGGGGFSSGGGGGGSFGGGGSAGGR